MSPYLIRLLRQSTGLGACLAQGRSTLNGHGYYYGLVRCTTACGQPLLFTGEPINLGTRTDLQKGYLLIQEFLPDNSFNTRITAIGNRAFGFRRFNRPNDFRTSGSGKIDWDRAQIDLEAVRPSFCVA